MENLKFKEPIIISASRATDIPAFYSEWFINRLEKGYVKWNNPFNNIPEFISLRKTKFIVFWSKNPKPIITYLNKIDEKGIGYYFQFTLNDYEDEGFEPNIPPLKERIKTFRELSNKIGKEKVIWRFDPLILTDKINIKKLIDKIYGIGNEIYEYTEKLVISFVDILQYKKVKKNLEKAHIKYKNLDEETMIMIAKEIQEINKDWKLEICTCAEKIDLQKYNIKHNKCIDDVLISKIIKEKSLIKFLDQNKFNKKDPGQRKECCCIMSKDIGQYNTCPHLCVYCYANYAKEIVEKNYRKHNKNFESIIE